LSIKSRLQRQKRRYSQLQRDGWRAPVHRHRWRAYERRN